MDDVHPPDFLHLQELTPSVTLLQRIYVTPADDDPTHDRCIPTAAAPTVDE